MASVYTTGAAEKLSSEFLIVRDGSVLHLLRGPSMADFDGDARCNRVKQGPLTVCQGESYERVAEIHVASSTDLLELIEDATKEPCGSDMYGARLLPP